MTRPSLRSLLKPRFRGALLGAAVGDALGFPYEGSSRSYMAALRDQLTVGYEKHRSGYFPRGQYSDDTQMTLATVESILAAGDVDGEALARAYVPLWRENRIVGRGSACTEAIQRLIDGSCDWTSCGAEAGRAGNGAAMRASPLGLWNYDRPEKLLHDVRIASEITHKDSRAVAGAAVVAAAVAHNVTHREIILGTFLDHVSEAARQFDEGVADRVNDIPRLLSLAEDVALEEISGLGLSGAYLDARDGITPFVIPTVIVALFYFLRSPTEYLETVGSCLLAGGDVDTTASIAGALSGALNGVDAIPDPLARGVLQHDNILRLADSFYALKEERRSRLERA